MLFFRKVGKRFAIRIVEPKKIFICSPPFFWANQLEPLISLFYWKKIITDIHHPVIPISSKVNSLDKKNPSN